MINRCGLPEGEIMNSTTMKRSSVSVSLVNYSIKLADSSKEKQHLKTLLYPVTTTIAGGSMFAILGGSGSGKTTLLNVIAGRYDKKAYAVNGEILFNNSTAKCGIGYVTQNDYLLPYLTVRETLMFAAKMRVSPQQSVHRRSASISSQHGADQLTSTSVGSAYDQVVDDVILDLGLKECANTRVGDSVEVAYGKRGISGGEKRRVSIAVQIISDPQVLCADEPTSGLDSFTAITVVESLLRLSKGAHSTTVICSIHQPRADVFAMFDAVLLLSKGGHPVYCGPTAQMCQYFAGLGYACPVDSNPADYFVDISSVDPRSGASERGSGKIVGYLVQSYNKHAAAASASKSSAAITTGAVLVAGATVTPLISTLNNNNNNGGGEALSRLAGNSDADGVPPNHNTIYNNNMYQAGWFRQVLHLTRRFFTNSARDPSNFLGGLLQAVALGCLVMVIFWQLGDSLEDVESMNALMYIVISMEPYICNIILVERYCAELRVFDRELQDDLYHPSAYFTAHLVSTAPQLVLQPVLYALPIYYGCNCRHGVQYMCMFVAVNIAVSFTVNGMVWMCVSAHRAFSVASLLANMTFTFITLVAGFLVNSDDIPIYVAWVKSVSFLSYAYRILMTNQYTDYTVPGCPSSNPDECGPYDGNSILAARGIATNDYVEPWCAMLGICGIYYAVSVLLLHFLRNPVTGVVGGELNEDGETESADEDFLSTLMMKDGGVNEEAVTLSVTVAENDDNRKAQHKHMSAPLSLEAMRHHSDVEAQQQQQQLSPVDGKPLTMGMTVSIRNVSLFVCTSNSGSGSGGRSTTQSATTTSSTTTVPLISDASSSNNNSSNSSNSKRKRDKTILLDVCADITPGRLVALMGGSGSGKTTLLNLIAGRVKYSRDDRTITSGSGSGTSESTAAVAARRGAFHGSGVISFNGSVPSHEQIRQMIGYVQQFDFHLPTLTVRETLAFHAALRLSSDLSPAEQLAQVERVIATLGLKQCAGTRVGGEELKGVSGGEKRRLSVGIQLLGDPAVCLLDEPTTGLDAFTARHVVETLQDLARKQHRAVVVSIHQPRYDVFALVDDVILLSRGRQVWAGPARRMLEHFESVGYPCPLLTNPADFILDLSSIDLRTPQREAESRSRLDKLVASFETYKRECATELLTPALTTATPAFTTTTATTQASAASQVDLSLDKPLSFCLPLLVQRSYRNSVRQPLVSTTRITQGLFFALILCCFYAPVGNTQSSVQNIIGNLYELTALCFIGMLSCVAIFPAERNVFYREYVDGGYPALGFFFSYFILAVPFLVISAVLIALLLCYAIGLQPSGSAVAVFSYVVFCFILVGECLGVAFCALFVHVGFAVNVMSVVISIFCILAGYMSIGMPVELVYISYLSPVTWGSYILANTVLRDKTFSCTADEQIPVYSPSTTDDGTTITMVCPLPTGSAVLDLYNMNSTEDGAYGIVFHMWVLAMITAVFFVGTLVVFRVKAFQLSH